MPMLREIGFTVTLIHATDVIGDNFIRLSLLSKLAKSGSPPKIELFILFPKIKCWLYRFFYVPYEST